MTSSAPPARTHRRSVFVVVGLLLATLGAALVPSTASAHTNSSSYVYLEVFDDAIAGRVEIPINDINDVLGLDIEADSDASLEQIEATAAPVQAYIREHLSISPEGDATPWSYSFGEVDRLDLGGGSYAIYDFEVDQRFDPPPRRFEVTFDGIIESNSQRSAFLLIATDWGSGTFNNEANEFLKFDRGSPTELVDLDDTSWWKGMRGVVDLGVEHIRIGTDHILFVFALVLPSVLVFRRGSGDRAQSEDGWQPSTGFRSTLWRVLKVVTMFTLAHSITLALGGLEIIELSPRLVETIIAISIAAAAIHNIRPIFVNKEWALAFGFGLFHGFGFAGLLSDLGLDRSNRVPSLLGFNIGVEIGQAAIILMVFPMLFIVRRTRYYVKFMYAGSIVLAIVSLAWATERIFEYDLQVNSIVDPLLQWPRSALLVAVGYAIAGAVWWVEKSNDRLLDVAADESSDSEEDLAELVDV